jgi:hypothetical protein
LEGRADMNGSKLSRIFAPAVTIISLAAWLTWPAHEVGRLRRKASYVPRHARAGKVTPQWVRVMARSPVS